jgi:hypothetical protein
MRKILIVAGLLLGAALFTGTSSTPAQAWVGCVCAKIGAPAVCVEGPGTCTLKNGGACVLPCDYKEPVVKKGKKHKKHKKKK